MNIFKKLGAEFLGTLIFVLVISLCITQKIPVTPIAIGLILMIIVYTGSKISGGHYNPVVTFSVWLTMQNKINARDMFLYMIFQFIGGMAGALISWGLTLYTVRFYPLLTSNGSDMTRAFFAEFIFSSLLVFVVLVFVVSNKYKGNPYFGFLIGSSLSVAVFSIGSISGAAINPAVGFGIAIVNFLSNVNNDFMFVWIYLTAPFLGGMFANFLFYLFFLLENINIDDDENKVSNQEFKCKFNKYKKRIDMKI